MQQELLLQAPSMLIDRFFVKKQGKEYQTWEHVLYSGDEIEFYLESESQWVKATVKSWDIDDGSGNAPGCDAHFFALIERNQKKYKYDLHEDLHIRMEVPGDDELVARSGWCEGLHVVEEETYYNPAVYGTCPNPTTRYVAPSGQASWYCDKHRPVWATQQSEVTQ